MELLREALILSLSTPLHLLLLLMIQTTITEAVDIVAMVSSDCTVSGGEQVCWNFPSSSCCGIHTAAVNSVQFKRLPPNSQAQTYVGGECFISNREPVVGPGNMCIPVFMPTGAGYVVFSQESPMSARTKCKGSRKPNGIFYSESTDINGAYWILEVDPEMLLNVQSQFRALPTDSKLGWLQARGAHYFPSNNSTLL